MDNLRVVLIIIGSLVIVALLIHGFWINKKERSATFSSPKKNKIKESSHEMRSEERNNEDFLDDIGSVRVVAPKNDNLGIEPIINHDVPNVAPMNNENSVDKPIQQDFFIDENSSVSLPEIKISNVETISESPIKVEQAPSKIKSTTSVKKSQPEPDLKPAPKPKSEPEQESIDFVVLFVAGLNGDKIRGDLLFSSIIQSGFKFGDMQIFHRHLDPAGNGPVLFSLANMLEPGTLDPETMHEMTFDGVSIFMTLPSYGNTAQNFKIMLQSAQRIADDVNGVVLDDEHHMLTPQKIDSYKTRIKNLIV